MKNSKIILLAVLFLGMTSTGWARIMTGSVSEQKQTAKVVKLLNSARKHVEKGKMQNAIDTYWKVLAVDPDESYAYLELGEVYWHLRIYDRAAEMLNSGLDLGKNELDADTLCNYYCILTQVYTDSNQQGLSNKTLIKAAEVAPRNPMPRKILGDIYLKNNRVSSAAKAYKKALELDTDYQPAIDAMKKLRDEYGDKLPKEDKDPDYIERAAVKLKPQKPASNTRQQVAAKPAEKPVTKQTEKAVNKIKEKPVDNSVEPKTVTTKPVETVKVEETTTISEETQTAKLSAIEETKQEKPKADKKKAEERPIPLKAEDMPKAEIAEEELSEEEKAALADKIEENIDLFLAGDSTQKEEALNFLIQCGTSGLRAVEELIYNPNPDVRILAVRALPLFEAHKEEVKAILDDASDDIDPTVQEEIEKALSLL